MTNDDKKSYSLFKFWAELAVYGCAQKWADAYSTVNFDNGFWLIQKSDCSKNWLKNPRILWSNLFVIGVLGYNQLLKPEFFSLFTSLWVLGSHLLWIWLTQNVLLKKTVLALCCFLYGVPQKLYRQGRGRGIHKMSTLVYNPI